MAKFTSIFLLALCAFQSTLAWPRLQDSDPMAKARVVVSKAEQDIYMAPTTSPFDDMDTVVDTVFRYFLSESITLSDLMDGTPDKLAERADALRNSSAEYAKHQLEMFSSGTTTAAAAIQQILQTAAAEIGKIGEEDEPVKALLSHMQDAYAEYLKSATAAVSEAVQTVLNLTNEAIDNLEADPGNGKHLDGIAIKIIHTETRTQHFMAVHLKRVHADVQNAIAAFFKT